MSSIEGSPFAKKPWQHSLRFRILGMLLLVGVLVIGVFFQFVRPRLIESVNQILFRETQQQLQVVGESLIPFMIQNQYAAIYENLDELKKRKPGWTTIELYGEGGIRLYPLGSKVAAQTAGIREFTFAIPFRAETLGKLAITVDFAADRAEIENNLRLVVAVLASIFFAALVVIGVFLEFLVSRRIRELSSAANLLAQRDYSATLPHAENDEIGDLVRNFSRMRDSVQAFESSSMRAEESLRLLNETLEQRIEEEAVKIREQENMLIQQSRLAAMGEMIGNIAHQWRQPINALNLLLANIKDAYEYDDLTQDYLEKQVQMGQGLISSMSATIDDFRNFFKPNKEKVVFCIEDALNEAIKLVLHSFKYHNIELHVDSGPTPHTTLGYPNEFAQVVLNALSNAKDAILSRRMAGKVQISVWENDQEFFVSIRDNGGGIPGDILAKVFEPYFTTKEKGTGIGLYMSKMIMDHMGGNIIVRNVEDGAELLLGLTGSARPL